MSQLLRLRQPVTPVLATPSHAVGTIQKFLKNSAIAVLCLIPEIAAAGSVANNPGDPLYCRPNEGVQFIIVNGGSGVFTADPDCYGENINNDTDTPIATGHGGTLTLNASPSGGNYVYAPSPLGFTGQDTFSIAVTTVFNSAGGPGSAGGTSFGTTGPATLSVTLNVIPATTTLIVAGAPTPVPVPVGSISGCSAPGNGAAGPTAAAIYGCIIGIIPGSVSPSHGALSSPTATTLRYTPANGYTGSDTFTYQAVGVNNDGNTALNSGDVTVQVTVTSAPATTPAPPTVILSILGLGLIGIFLRGTRKSTPV